MVTQQDKLDILQRLDPRWCSLNDRICCRRCGTVFAAADIAVLGGSRAFGPLRLHCRNEACEATPADWISAFRQSAGKQTRHVSATHKGRVFRARRAKLVRPRGAVAVTQMTSFFHFVAAILHRLNRDSGFLWRRTSERFRIAGIP